METPKPLGVPRDRAPPSRESSGPGSEQWSGHGLSAYALATLGEAERAKRSMNRALLIDPDDWNMRYNFACVLLIHLDEVDAALDVLGPVLENVAAGYFLSHIKVDPDFVRLRDNARFKALIAAAEARLAAENDSGSSSRL